MTGIVLQKKKEKKKVCSTIMVFTIANKKTFDSYGKRLKDREFVNLACVWKDRPFAVKRLDKSYTHKE